MAQVAITRTQFQEKLKQLIAKDDRDCELLVDVYNDVKTCTENSALVKDLVLQHDPDFFEHVKQGITDLREADRPILVIGETSAGKSSFLNLLIGRKVLPELAAPCTHCMCCIKKGRKLEAHVSSFDGSDLFGTEIISADGKSDKEFRDELQELVNEDNCDEALDRYIEIFVPSSILEDNVYLVDTPGFGENEQVTKSLMKYLPNAIGIIFILNTTVSIGIAEDRGVLILDEIKQLREEGKIPSFDPTKILFIGNKWDQIPEEERHAHRLKIIRKMKTVWPKFHENQFVPLSVIYVLRLQYTASVQEDYKSATTDYETVLDRIRQVVEHCCSARSKVHKRLLLSVFKHMKTFVDATVTHILLSVEEKQAKVKRLQGLVKNMVSTYNEGKAKMVTLADHIQISVVEEFHQYLNNMENRQHIFPWKKSNMPKGTDYNAVKEKAFVTIRAFITEAFTERIAISKPVIQDLEGRMSTFIAEVNAIKAKIESILEGPSDETSCPDADNIKTIQFGQDGNEFSGGEIAALVITAPLWIPLGLVGAVTVLPISASIDVIIDKSKMSNYKAKPREHLDRWVEEIIRREYSKEHLKKMMFWRLTIHITAGMNRMEKSIAELENLFHHLAKNVETDEVPEGYYEIRDLTDRMDGKLNRPFNPK